MTAPASTTSRPIVPILMSARSKARKASAALTLITEHVTGVLSVQAELDAVESRLTDMIDAITVESGTPMGEPDGDEAEASNVVPTRTTEYGDDGAPSPDNGLTFRPEIDIAVDPQPGDIYSTSWGYDQTNVEFFKVVARTAKTATLRRIGSTIFNRRVYPNPDVECIDTHLAGNHNTDQYNTDHERGYSEKVCRAKKGSQPFRWLTIDGGRGASPYTGGGQHETHASGGAGH